MTLIVLVDRGRRARFGDAARRRDPGRRRVRLRRLAGPAWRSSPGRSRSRSRRSSAAARPPGIAGAVMFGGFLLNGYQAAIPELAPFANLTWFGWTADHIPLAGVYDWASLAARRGRDASCCSSSASRRSSAATSARPPRIPAPRLPRALLGPARSDRARVGERFPTGARVGRRARALRPRDRQLGESFIEQIGESPDVRARARRPVFPGRRHGHGRRVPPARVRRVRPDPGRARRGDAGRRLGLGRDDRDGSRCCSRRRSAAARWPLAGGLGVFAAIAASSWRSRPRASASAWRPSGGDVRTPIVGTLGARPVRRRTGRHRAWRSAASFGPRSPRRRSSSSRPAPGSIDLLGADLGLPDVDPRSSR